MFLLLVLSFKVFSSTIICFYFFQIDLEISFTTIDDIISLIENLLQSCWPQNLKSFTIPFQRINYQDAMLNYASDKPDLRSDVKVMYLILMQKNIDLNNT